MWELSKHSWALVGGLALGLVEGEWLKVRSSKKESWGGGV